MRKTLSLAPATWIWYPSKRTLANTFILFRREFKLEKVPENAPGWITACSRYELTINGRRVQWGPAPCDPRHEEADPFDAAPYLKKGHNVLAVRVLFYGFGEGTWVAGNPGLLYRLQVGDACIYSDASTVCCVDYAHRPGQFQRWFLRALQEDYDARREMPGWQGEAFSPSSAWKPAMVTSECADRPSVYTAYDEYTAGGFSPIDDSGRLYKREIPMPQEVFVPAASLVESGTVT